MQEQQEIRGNQTLGKSLEIIPKTSDLHSIMKYQNAITNKDWVLQKTNR